MRNGNHPLGAVKALEKSLPTQRQYVAEEYLCPDGKAQIDIRLPEGIDLFNPLSMGRQKELNADFFGYIDAKLYTIPTFYPIRVTFHGSLPAPGTQEEIRAALREHYTFVLRDKQEDLRVNAVKSFWLALFGAAALTVYFALEVTRTEPLFMELLSIAGSFALWSAFDSWVLERKKLRLERLYALQSALSEVRFEAD